MVNFDNHGPVTQQEPTMAQAKSDTVAAAEKKTKETGLSRVQVTDVSIQRQFQAIPPDAEQVEQMGRIRLAGQQFAQVIKNETNGSPDQTAAIRKVREAVFTANACVMLRGK